MRLGGKTKLLGVIGHPIEHSLSPGMHNAAFAASGQDYAYVAMDVRPEHLREAVRGLVALGFRGFNVTMPHKEEIIPFLDHVEESARLAGAVNTVVVEDGSLHGLNTDGSGFLRACGESGVGFARKSVLVLGAGGAAAAIAAAALGEGASELGILNRSPERAGRLAERLRGSYPATPIRVHPPTEVDEAFDGAFARAFAGVDALVNATYLGMKDEDPLPVPEELPWSGLVVCDAVYRPEAETRLVRRARSLGAKVVDGSRMLLYQGVEAQRVWTGREPDVEAMSSALPVGAPAASLTSSEEQE